MGTVGGPDGGLLYEPAGSRGLLLAVPTRYIERGPWLQAGASNRPLARPDPAQNTEKKQHTLLKQNSMARGRAGWPRAAGGPRRYDWQLPGAGGWVEDSGSWRVLGHLKGIGQVAYGRGRTTTAGKRCQLRGPGSLRLSEVALKGMFYHTGRTRSLPEEGGEGRMGVDQSGPRRCPGDADNSDCAVDLSSHGAKEAGPKLCVPAEHPGGARPRMHTPPACHVRSALCCSGAVRIVHRGHRQLDG